MLEEPASTFPANINDDDIYDMMLTGIIQAVCCSCKTLNNIDADDGGENFKCNKCGTFQLLPMYNPEEFDRLMPKE